ncbi:hypothetical protein P2L35_13905 [Enterococcus faecium]|uniref:hypothetical protein n=1 Tax=Enterococcus faecium TaxID=1352 RepID=UPI0025B0389D|nr:hypothetical protein [Enterococcus faecium]MDN3040791.1 hypothetical protein [Enterococcus faecium]
MADAVDDEEYRCHGCKKLIRDGEGRYTGRERLDEFWHWDCHKKLIVPDTKWIDDLLTRSFGKQAMPKKRRVRDGTGPTAQRLARKLSAALLAQHDLDVEPGAWKFWVQPPSYRGPRWDLANWGAHAPHPVPPNLTVQVSSWERMSTLVKQEELKLHPDGIFACYDVA